MAAHQKLGTFVIGLGITMVITTAIGILDHNHVVFAGNGHNNNCGNGG
jgi:hypothetical protein